MVSFIFPNNLLEMNRSQRIYIYTLVKNSKTIILLFCAYKPFPEAERGNTHYPNSRSRRRSGLGFPEWSRVSSSRSRRPADPFAESKIRRPPSSEGGSCQQELGGLSPR